MNAFFFSILLLPAQSVGLIASFVLLLLSFLGVHFVKLASVGWSQTKAPPKKPSPPPAKEEPPQKKPPQKREPVYYIVKRKNTRGKRE